MSEAASRITVSQFPFNAETPPASLADSATPAGTFFVRNHFAMPQINLAEWRLSIDGLVEKPVSLSLDEIRALPATDVMVTLECAGNGRKSLSPRPEGVTWGYGAAATATFTGVPVKRLLDMAIPGRAIEVVFLGADSGYVDSQPISFGRSLPLAIARLPDTIVAWQMNGEPLSPEHGAPVRLVVPGWYAVASVKWLSRITLTREPFTGHFQHNDYLYQRQTGIPDGTPVTWMRIRSVFAHPADGQTVPLGPVEVRGSAWSGAGPVTRVELSTDDARSWNEARLDPAPSSPYAARRWSYEWRPEKAGDYVLAARATDQAGAVQPLEPVWNLRGYGNNAVQRVAVTVS
jgi:DMSO/TMAO reductase YedYZ molybdopterin-dependent catalytic subunit